MHVPVVLLWISATNSAGSQAKQCELFPGAAAKVVMVQRNAGVNILAEFARALRLVAGASVGECPSRPVAGLAPFDLVRFSAR